MKKFTIALFCGGPSLERGISLNSARSVMDHMTSAHIDILPIYVNRHLQFYEISPSQLYSNTPSDFDFKLSQTARALDDEALAAKLKQAHIVFPAIHGAFGEDGMLQDKLTSLSVPFVGCAGEVCRRMFNKHTASKILSTHGFNTIPSLLISWDEPSLEEKLHDFFAQHGISRAVVKPAAGGSSIGVSAVTTALDAAAALHSIFTGQIDTLALVEPYCEGQEFTVLVLQNHEGEPVALVPTEIELSNKAGEIFDYRRKYLPTANTIYHTPPRFSEEVISRIRDQAEKIFTLFGMKDFARIDGWLLKDGSLVFSDFNPISGMEQNSFLFRQAAVVGMSHAASLHYILRSACHRQNLSLPPLAQHSDPAKRMPVAVLFGGGTAERQVSLMSGTNTWLKLRRSQRFYPRPFLLDKDNNVWELPYSYTLNHTVEEIYENCMLSESTRSKALLLIEKIQARLGAFHHDTHLETDQAKRYSFGHFIQKAQSTGAFVFIALHGGDGENGHLQQQLEEANLFFNGSGACASALCMDKLLTGHAIINLADDLVTSLTKKTLTHEELSACVNPAQAERLWAACVHGAHTHTLIIKPRRDGCSAGIVHLQCAADLGRYAQLIHHGAAFIPACQFPNQPDIIEMPPLSTDYIIEPYIQTDRLRIADGHVAIQEDNGGWLELTVGVVDKGRGELQALNPSITIAESAVLTIEEKFQGGTGINITPPPSHLLTKEQVGRIQAAIQRVATTLGIQNYARIDIFFNRKSGQLIVIEANSLPALTPSTVIYHQALAETPPLHPQALLELLITTKLEQTCQEPSRDR